MLEGQGGRPGQQRRGIQASAADAGQVERAQRDNTRGESGGVRGEVAAALDAGGQVDDLLVDMHGLLLAGLIKAAQPGGQRRLAAQSGELAVRHPCR